jgi:hypothetical protein
MGFPSVLTAQFPLTSLRRIVLRIILEEKAVIDVSSVMWLENELEVWGCVPSAGNEYFFPQHLLWKSAGQTFVTQVHSTFF